MKLLLVGVAVTALCALNVTAAAAVLRIPAHDRTAAAKRLAGRLARGLPVPALPAPEAQPSPPQLPAEAEEPAAADGTAADERGQRDFGSVYGGLALTENGTHVVVSLTVLDPAVEAAIRGSAPESEFTFVRARRSKRWLEDLTQRIGDDEAAQRAAGIRLIKEGAGDPQTGRVLIQVLDLTSAKRGWLEDRYGADNVSVSNGTAADVPVALNGPPRANDALPWSGGDFISDVFTGDCSSGFGVHRGADQALLTAGHCFPVLAYVFNGSITQLFGSFQLMGVVVRRSVDNALDSELIATLGSSSLVFTGGPASSVRSRVSGTTTSPINYRVCQDGAFEGQTCGLVIQSPVSMCIFTSGNVGGRVCKVYEADNTQGGIAAGEGDSGGPVFRFINSRLYATGIVTAGAGVARLCPTYNRRNDRLCYSRLYYTDINAILGRYGVSINR